jgi:hypothetical protein
MIKMTALLYIPTLFGVSIEVYFILLVLGIPTFFIWGWFFKKFIKVDKTRKIATYTATLVAKPLIYIGLIMLWFFSMSYHPTHDFDKEKWFADKETRYEISEDIIDSKMLIGKSKSDVRKLLGDEGNIDTSDYWNYYLGFRPGFANIDPDVLDIEFKDGKVIRVGQHDT